MLSVTRNLVLPPAVKALGPVVAPYRAAALAALKAAYPDPAADFYRARECYWAAFNAAATAAFWASGNPAPFLAATRVAWFAAGVAFGEDDEDLYADFTADPGVYVSAAGNLWVTLRSGNVGPYRVTLSPAVYDGNRRLSGPAYGAGVSFYFEADLTDLP